MLTCCEGNQIITEIDDDVLGQGKEKGSKEGSRETNKEINEEIKKEYPKQLLLHLSLQFSGFCMKARHRFEESVYVSSIG